MESYTLADGKMLNALKHRLRDVTRMLDASGKVFPAETLEASQVKHEVSVLVSELQVHGLLPVDVTTSQDCTRHHEDEPEESEERKNNVTTFDPTRYQEQMSLVGDPDVSDSETKAARLKRYAEVRWSPDKPCSFRVLTAPSSGVRVGRERSSILPQNDTSAA